MDYFRRGFCIVVCLCCLAGRAASAPCQEPADKPAAKATEQTPAQKEKPAENPQLPFQIQLLETHIRFEANGDSRKEVHTIVKINNVLGASEFARISFDYDRNFQQVEIPLVRITHSNGGISELLPSAVTDAPNPAVESYTAYHDVRVKFVRILGLQEGDTVEYRVLTTTTKPPLAPDFWLEHTFDRSGQVLEENYELDLPSSRKVELRIKPSAPPSAKGTTGSGDDARRILRWKRTYATSKDGEANEETALEASAAPDIGVSTFDWEFLAIRLAELMLPGSKPIGEVRSYEDSVKELSRRPPVAGEVREKALSLTSNSKNDLDRLKAIYKFVSTEISTVDLPLGSTGFRSRAAEDVLNSAYATSEDKYVLFAALATAVNLRVDPALTGFCDKSSLAMPDAFKHLAVVGFTKEGQYWLDPAVEVAPFGMITPSGGKCALLLNRGFFALNSTGHEWVEIPSKLPFAAFQKVSVEAVLTDSGQLTAKVKYVLRGENELLLRVAFHQQPKEKWKDIGSLLALSDGFRGQVSDVNATDPLDTEDPFTVEYEITQLKFADWSKKPVRIPALLPQIGLPDLPQAGPGRLRSKIELGTPLDVQTSMTLKLPAGTAVETPAGTALTRDYATYTSKYTSSQNTIVATRHIDFLKREVYADRAVDYDAFVRAVQNDQSQRFTLVSGETQSPPPSPTVPRP